MRASEAAQAPRVRCRRERGRPDAGTRRAERRRSRGAGPFAATAAPRRGARVHGHEDRPLPAARSRARRRAHHPQRRRPGHRRCNPLPLGLAAPARNRGGDRRDARRLRPARRFRGRVLAARSPPTARGPPGGSARSKTSRRPFADGLARLRTSPELARRDAIRGFVFNPEDGRLREVAARDE